MGKSETSKTSRHAIKPYRKTVLGNNNLAIFLKPSTVDIIPSPTQPHQRLIQNGGDNSPFDNISASHLYDLLKDVNKVMVKGAKLYESLKELRLCGWVMPTTIILSGPSEDLKVVKQAWIKRHLKSPRGYFINDLGMVQDFVVELIPQSPFMSLTTALFDAVADLNHQNVFPTKNDLHEYLKKHFSEIKTPDTKVIHGCLGRLIKDRRLYHNGRGYFVLCNENVLNDVISTQPSEAAVDLFEDDLSQNTDVFAPFLKGFKLSSSVTTSSSPGPTDLDMKAETFSNNKAIDETCLDNSVINTPNNIKSFFKRSNKIDKKFESRVNKQNLFSCGIGGTLTDSVTILSNEPVSIDLSQSIAVENKAVTDVNRSLENYIDSNLTGNERSDATIVSERSKIKRSRSFGGKDSKKAHKEVSFALVGSPSHENKHLDTNNYFKRSHSFGVGYTKNIYHRPTPLSSNTVHVQDGETEFINETRNVEHPSVYADIENSFVDDSIPFSKNESDRLKHFPDMRPVDEKPLEALTIYQDLGSELSLHNKAGTMPLSVSDLLSPAKEDSLAQELKDAYNVKGSIDTKNDIDTSLMSPRSRRRFGGIPYESQYVSEILEEDQKHFNDNNMDIVNSKRSKDKSKHKSHKATTKHDSKHAASNGVKLRPRSLKSAEEKKRDQKERNSLLFEEKRSSLKVMGMV